jgi:hypothetical protein
MRASGLCASQCWRTPVTSSGHPEAAQARPRRRVLRMRGLLSEMVHARMITYTTVGHSSGVRMSDREQRSHVWSVRLNDEEVALLRRGAVEARESPSALLRRGGIALVRERLGIEPEESMP